MSLQGRNGANGRNRTGDLLITNQLLYQLSYVGFVVLVPDGPIRERGG